MAKNLAIGVLGFGYNNIKIEGENIIYRVNAKLLSSSVIIDHPYLVISESINELQSSTPSSPIDLFVIRDLQRVDDTLKRKVKSGMGLEVNLANVRKMSGLQVGRWLNQIRKFYKFCKTSDCQFIFSSGANSVLEMISGPSLDALLKICDIEPESYWLELGDWIESKCHRR